MDKRILVHPYNEELLLIYVITWLNLKCIMLRDRGLTQKAINYMISLIRHSEKGRPKGTEKRLVVARGRGGSSLQRGVWEILRVMEMFHFLSVLVTT